MYLGQQHTGCCVVHPLAVSQTGADAIAHIKLMFKLYSNNTLIMPLLGMPNIIMYAYKDTQQAQLCPAHKHKHTYTETQTTESCHTFKQDCKHIKRSMAPSGSQFSHARALQCHIRAFSQYLGQIEEGSCLNAHRSMLTSVHGMVAQTHVHGVLQPPQDMSQPSQDHLQGQLS